MTSLDSFLTFVFQQFPAGALPHLNVGEWEKGVRRPIDRSPHILLPLLISAVLRLVKNIDQISYRMKEKYGKKIKFLESNSLKAKDTKAPKLYSTHERRRKYTQKLREACSPRKHAMYERVEIIF